MTRVCLLAGDGARRAGRSQKTMTNNTPVEQPTVATESAPPANGGRIRLNLGLALLIALAAAAAMARAVLAGFLNYDDPDYVARNYVLQAFTLANLKTIWFSFDLPQYYPMVFTSFLIERSLFGLNPHAFHATNVLLHALNSALAFYLGLRLTKNRFAAFVLGLLFAVHPVHVESVAWITERKDVLSAAFFFGAFLLYLRFSETDKARPYFWSLALFALGLLSKTMVATLPLWLLIVDWMESRRSAKQALYEKIPYFALSAGALAITWFSEHGGWAPETSRLEGVYSPWSAFAAPAFYLQKTLLPFDLSICYPPLHTNLALLAARIAVSVLLFAVAVWLLHRRSQTGMFLMFFFAGILPVLGILPFRYVLVASPVADHFLYLPILGFLGVIALAAAWLAGSSLLRRSAVLLVCLVAAAGLGYASWMRCGVFANSGTLFADALLKDSTSASASVSHMNLGIYLLERNNLLEAEPYLQEVVKRVPYSGRPRYLMGTLRLKQGRASEAVAYYREALERAPGSIPYRLGLADALLKAGSPKAAEREYLRVIKMDRKNPGALDGIGTIELTRDRAERALSLFARAAEVSPPSAERYYRMALALNMLGRPDVALRQLRTAAHLNPENPDIRLRLGDMYKAVGNYAQAINQYRLGLKLAPDNVLLLNNFAWTVATSDKKLNATPEEALLAAKRALDITGGQVPAILDTLAAAYARTGDFESAVESQERCINLLEDAGEPTEEESERLDLYRDEEPYTVSLDAKKPRASDSGSRGAGADEAEEPGPR